MKRTRIRIQNNKSLNLKLTQNNEEYSQDYPKSPNKYKNTI